MEFRALIENEYFNYLQKDYIAIAKVYRKGNLLRLTFESERGANNAFDEIQKDDKSGYNVIKKDNIVEVTKEK